jgi:hypothetical protein
MQKNTSITMLSELTLSFVGEAPYIHSLDSIVYPFISECSFKGNSKCVVDNKENDDDIPIELHLALILDYSKVAYLVNSLTTFRDLLWLVILYYLLHLIVVLSHELIYHYLTGRISWLNTDPALLFPHFIWCLSFTHLRHGTKDVVLSSSIIKVLF